MSVTMKKCCNENEMDNDIVDCIWHIGRMCERKRQSERVKIKKNNLSFNSASKLQQKRSNKTQQIHTYVIITTTTTKIVKGTERNWLFPFVFEFVYCRFSYLLFVFIF